MADYTILALGAGVQSTTLALLAKHGVIGPMPTAGIFADTGWEPLRVYQHLRWLIGCDLEVTAEGRVKPRPGVYQAGVLPFPVYVAVQGDIRADIEAAATEGARLAQPPAFLRHPDGKRGQIRRACTYEYKVKAIDRTMREIAGIPKRKRKIEQQVERWFGISLDEAGRMRDSDLSWVTNRYPLIELEMTRQGCLEWLSAHGYPEPPKSSCIGCPFHSDRYWRTMKDQYPDEWADAVHVDKLIRNGLPGVRLPAFLHAQRVPLDQVDLRTMRERGQADIFDQAEDGFMNECEGHCGV